MDISLAKGKYVVGVSGGVDSVVLLDVLCRRFSLPDWEFVVAHFDHGIRSDSAQDAFFVKTLAERYDCVFELGAAQLGLNASEDKARTARYDFLRSVLNMHQAQRILTAHHQDDLLETMLLHLQRGTGRSGLSPMLKTKDIVRPLLHMPKKDIVDYAIKQQLVWHEDSTNVDDMYARNKLRKLLQAKLTPNDRSQLISIYNRLASINPEIDKLIAEVYQTILTDTNEILRSRLVVLPVNVGLECIKLWLNNHGLSSANKQLILRCYIAAKTMHIGKKIDLTNKRCLYSRKNTLKIM